MLKTSKGEPAGYVKLKIASKSTVAALSAQISAITTTPIPKAILPEGASDLGESFKSLLSSIDGVVKLTDQIAEVRVLVYGLTAAANL